MVYRWRRKGYRGSFRVSALIVNMVMCFLMFLLVRGLENVWDFCFVERIEVFGDDGSEDLTSGFLAPVNGVRRASVCGSEAISELGLNAGAEGDEMDSTASTNSGGGGRFMDLLRSGGFESTMSIGYE